MLPISARCGSARSLHCKRSLSAGLRVGNGQLGKGKGRERREPPWAAMPSGGVQPPEGIAGVLNFVLNDVRELHEQVSY